MSYSCFISFKKIDEKNIFPFLKEFKKFINEHMEEIAEEYYSYCPIFRKRIETAPNLSALSKEELKETKNWVINTVFKFRYFYDSKRNQLGIYGVPNCAYKLFDGSVHFQNSCDQDYERKTYKGIEEFEKIFDYWFLMDEETFFAEYYKKYKQSLDREYMDEEKDEKNHKERFEYIKRTMIYNEIWDPISNTLFDDDNAIYLSLYDINNASDTTKQYEFIKFCFNKQKEWEESIK